MTSHAVEQRSDPDLAPTPRRTPERTGKVLIVEDTPSIADVLSSVLDGDGFTTLIAADGPAALAAFESDRFDLILLDLMIPGINGLEVCRTIRRTSRVPIIIVSARATESDRVVGLASGADDYLTKPFSLPELRARIHAVLRRAGTLPSASPHARAADRPSRSRGW